MSMTVTEFPQLAHTESSNTNSVRTGSEPRLTHLQESGSQRSSGKKKKNPKQNKNALLKTKTRKDVRKPLKSLAIITASRELVFNSEHMPHFHLNTLSHRESN